ncbi:MAG TPA: hypothetical protein VMZ92_19295 [Planctomycetota bacterium]|nr:hypothetical protein [Planctomycetota bacterium]
MERTIVILAVLAALLMTVSAAADTRPAFGGRGRHNDRGVTVTLYIGGAPRVNTMPRVHHPASVRPRPPRQPVYRQSTYFRHPDPAAYWISRYGGQAYRHGPYLYEPVRSWDGVRRYRRIRIGH